MIDKDGYRKNVGIILCNSQNKLLICKRFGEKSWQFPQGGFEENENAESAKDGVKEESQDEEPQVKNEKETEQSTDNIEAKLNKNKEDSVLKDIDKTKS